LVNERMTEVYENLKDKMQRSFEELAEQLEKRGRIDEKAVKALVKVLVGKELEKFRGEIEERLSKYGVDAEIVRQVINEVQKRLTDEIDKRVMHLVDVINEVGNVNKDILDLINEVLKTVVEDEEKIEELRNELRSLLDEERIEELLYKALMKHGVIKRRRRKWTPLIAGLSVLVAIVTGFIINPIATLVVLFIAIVVLLRW